MRTTPRYFRSISKLVVRVYLLGKLPVNFLDYVSDVTGLSFLGIFQLRSRSNRTQNSIATVCTTIAGFILYHPLAVAATYYHYHLIFPLRLFVVLSSASTMTRSWCIALIGLASFGNLAFAQVSQSNLLRTKRGGSQRRGLF